MPFSNGPPNSNVLPVSFSTALQIASGILSADAIGPMETITERKVFFIDSDRGKVSGFADWTIFSASGIAVGTSEGTTDTDITPNATFDQ